MKKRLLSILFVLLMLLPCFVLVQACDEDQSNEYLVQLLFGSSSSNKASNDKVKMLEYAVYLCSEQANKNGQDKIDYLKQKKVKVSSLDDININRYQLKICSHTTWDYSDNISTQKTNRKKILQNTVNKVFDFGFLNEVFHSKDSKSESFAELLYYFHILADYVTEDSLDTQVTIKSNKKTYSVSYSGEPYVKINGDKPSFVVRDLSKDVYYVNYEGLDSKGRTGQAFAMVGPETVDLAGPREDISKIKPSGWNQSNYYCLVNTTNLYNRSHLIAHSLGGVDKDINLITGTRYLNWEGMKTFEDKVLQYVKETSNHVLYRVTPIYDGDNLIASGVQMEGYSIEDEGEGICFNVYCFNVQPGVEIDYSSGKNKSAELAEYNKNVLLFATKNGGENNPDLVYEIKKCLENIFKDQKETKEYKSLMNQIDKVAEKSRAIGNNACAISYKNYLNLKKYENEYYKVLKKYVPKLLENEDFFKKAFN